MYVKIRLLDGTKTCTLVLSKKTKVKDMKAKIQHTLDVPVDKQRLFYNGKQLGDEYSLFNYNVKLNDVIQLMVKPDDEKETNGSSIGNENVPSNSQECKVSAENTPGCSSSADNTTPGCSSSAENITPGCSSSAENTTPGCSSRAENTTPGCSSRAENTTPGGLSSDENSTPGGSSCDESSTTSNSSIDINLLLDGTSSDENTLGDSSSDENAKSANDIVEFKPAKSKYYEVGDYVDAVMESEGAWFEAQITHILVNVDKVGVCYENDLTFKVIYLKYKDDGDSGTLTFDDIRPIAKRLITNFDEIPSGLKVMGNYNPDKPRERGFWFDMLIWKKHSRKNRTEFTATVLLMGKNQSETRLNDLKIKFSELYEIETCIRIPERTEEDVKHLTTEPKSLRQIAPECSTCDDIKTKHCKDCGCAICGGKQALDKLIVCDECQHYFHIWCLKPPLETVPEEDEWFCPGCKRDPSEVIGPGQKLKESKKKAKMASANSTSNRDWGQGMACVGRTKSCNLVPSDHFGPIPGIEVGQSYLYRVQASEAGVHRPHVSGIHGREDTGAFSIVLSGGYEDDVDNGDFFLYTGSGGRDLSGNKRTSCQAFDQELTRMNKALARNCNAPIDAEKGNEAIDWKKGKPVRVLRNAKAAKHSKYAPPEGNRYDGIYKVVKYYPVKGSSDFIVWRFELRRDDEAPAPWTEEGKKRIKELGLQMIYPEGYEEAQAAKEASKQTKRKIDPESEAGPSCKKSKQEYTLPSQVQKHIANDTIDASAWTELKSFCKNGQTKFLEKVQEKFLCIICQDLVFKPITLDCLHCFCHDCLKRAFKIESDACNSCPCCRKEIDQSVLDSHLNKPLQSILTLLFPGYTSGR